MSGPPMLGREQIPPRAALCGSTMSQERHGNKGDGECHESLRTLLQPAWPAPVADCGNVPHARRRVDCPTQYSRLWHERQTLCRWHLFPVSPLLHVIVMPKPKPEHLRVLAPKAVGRAVGVFRVLT